jgi:hypothetical protein
VPLGPDVLVSEQRLQFVARHHKPQPVGRIDYENDALAVFVVVLPQLTVPALPGHVKRRKTHILVCGNSCKMFKSVINIYEKICRKKHVYSQKSKVLFENKIIFRKKFIAGEMRHSKMI